MLRSIITKFSFWHANKNVAIDDIIETVITFITTKFDAHRGMDNTNITFRRQFLELIKERATPESTLPLCSCFTNKDIMEMHSNIKHGDAVHYAVFIVMSSMIIAKEGSVKQSMNFATRLAEIANTEEANKEVREEYYNSIDILLKYFDKVLKTLVNLMRQEFITGQEIVDFEGKPVF